MKCEYHLFIFLAQGENNQTVSYRRRLKYFVLFACCLIFVYVWPRFLINFIFNNIEIEILLSYYWNNNKKKLCKLNFSNSLCFVLWILQINFPFKNSFSSPSWQIVVAWCFPTPESAEISFKTSKTFPQIVRSQQTCDCHDIICRQRSPSWMTSGAVSESELKKL